MQPDSLDAPDKLAVTPSPFDDSIEQKHHKGDDSVIISDSLEKEVNIKSTIDEAESKVVEIAKSVNMQEESESIEKSVETPVSVDVEIIGTIDDDSSKTSLEISVDQDYDESINNSKVIPITIEDSESKTVDIPITIERTSEASKEASDDYKIIESVEIPVSVDEFEAGMYNLIIKSLQIVYQGSRG